MIGNNISHYKIIEKLGEGGMGEVYLAEDTKLKRQVAIKFLPEHLTKDKENVERFEREAEAAAALNHPNIVTIHDVIEENNQICIVMEYVDGSTLREIICRGEVTSPLPLGDTINYTIQIAEGLSKAHQAGIVHRDIKPENIIIDQDARVKILDFGLAKLKGVSKLTKETSTLGTIHYMSPEQIKGQEVDQRSDIWSLGVVFYEMLSGDVPFKGDYDQAVAYSIQSEEFEPIDDISPEHDEMLHKLLAKEPENRYQSLKELTDALTESKGSKQTKGISKKQKYLIYSISIIALLIVGYFLITYLGPDLSQEASTEWENSIAVLPFDNISNDSEQDYFCDGMTEQIITNLSKIKRLKVIARTSVMTYKNTDKQIPQIGKELNVSHILEGSIRKFGNQIRVTAQLINTEDGSHLWADDFDRELEHVFEVQDDVSQMIASNLLSTLSIQEIAEIKTDRPNNIENYDRYMQAKGFHSKFLETQNPDYLHDAILLLKEILNLEPEYLAANVELADAYNTYFNAVAKTDEEKSRYLQLQKKYFDIAYGLNPKSLDVQYLKIFISGAEQDIKYYEEIRLKKFLEYLKIDPNRAAPYMYVGIWLRDYDLIHQSLLYFNKAVGLNPLFTWNYSSRGWAYFKIGAFEKAELDYKKAFTIEPHDYDNLGKYIYYLISFKRIREAEKLIIQWQDKKPNDNNLRQLQTLLYAVKGDKENALSSFNKVVFDKKYDASFARAILYLLLNDQEKAVELIIEGEKDYSSSTIIYDGPVGISRSKYFGYLNLPYYKILHNDPRFQEILSKHKEIYEENLAKYGDIDI